MQYYAKSTNSFYDPEINGGNIPSDAVEIAPEDHAALLQGQSEGKVITADENGYPVLIDPPQPPEPTLEDLRAAKINEINTAFTQAAAALTEGYPESERLTWPVQQQEALAWEADPDTPTPYLDGLALARGIPAEEMRQKTLAQTQLFMAASQQLVGKRQRLRDLVYEATTQAELDAIQWDEPEAE